MEFRLTSVITIFFSFLLTTSSAHSLPLEKEWGDWVKERHHDINCPWGASTNKRGANKAQARVCVWPGNLSLSLEQGGLSFTQQVEVFSKQARVLLPGSEKHWPSKTTLNQKPATIIEVSKLPYIQLKKGKHIIKGRFNWKTRPASLTIPTNIAFVNLSEQGKKLQINRHGNRLILPSKKVITKSKNETV